MSALVETVVFALQQAAALPDTIVTRQVVERSWWDTVVSIAGGLMTISILVLTAALVPAAWNFRKTHKKWNDVIDRVYADIFPIVGHASTIADNVNYITTSVRTDIQQVNRTITDANRRLHQAVVRAERRLAEFDALLEVVQREAEGAFVSTAATVRGVRAGARALREDLEHDEDEREPQLTRDSLEEEEDYIDGDHGRGPDHLEAPPPGRAADRPRIRPRRGIG